MVQRRSYSLIMCAKLVALGIFLMWWIIAMLMAEFVFSLTLADISSRKIPFSHHSIYSKQQQSISAFSIKMN